MAQRKYYNKKVEYNGIVFDSKKEKDRWVELSLLEKAGKVSDLQRQVKFVLLPTQCELYERYSEKTGKKLKSGTRMLEQGVSYIADFVYIQDGKSVVEDCKGIKTKEYILKRKLMLYFHGIKIKET